MSVDIRRLLILMLVQLCILPLSAQDFIIEDDDYYIQTPDTLINRMDYHLVADSLVLGRLMGVKLDVESAVLTICPDIPESWNGSDLQFSTPDYDLLRICHGDSVSWYFMGAGDFYESYDSIVVCLPAACILTGELADEEGICFLDAETHKNSVLAAFETIQDKRHPDCQDPEPVTSEQIMSRKARREVKRQQRMERKRQRQVATNKD